MEVSSHKIKTKQIMRSLIYLTAILLEAALLTGLVFLALYMPLGHWNLTHFPLKEDRLSISIASGVLSAIFCLLVTIIDHVETEIGVSDKGSFKIFVTTVSLMVVRNIANYLPYAIFMIIAIRCPFWVAILPFVVYTILLAVAGSNDKTLFGIGAVVENYLADIWRAEKSRTHLKNSILVYRQRTQNI